VTARGNNVRAAFYLTMAGLLLAGTAAIERASAESLREAVEHAINFHPEMRRDRSFNRAAEHFVDENYAGYLPSLDFDISSGLEITDSPTTRSAGFTGRPLWRTDAAAVLTQMLFDGFETQNRVASARFDALASGKTLVASGERVGFESVIAYLSLLEAQERLRVAEDDLAELSRVAGLVGSLVQGGRASRVDADQSDSRVAFSQAELASAQGEVRTAIARYTEIVGKAPGRLERPEAPDFPEAEDLNAAIVAAMIENPEAQVTGAQLDARKADIEVERAPYAPRFDLELSGGFDNNQDGGLGEDNDVSFLVRMRWNVFNGFGDLARVRAATFESHAAAKEDGEVRRLIREDVRVAYLDLQTARDRLEPLRGDALAAGAVYQAYLQQFDVGTRSLLDLLDARNDLTDSAQALVTGEYDVLRAQYGLLFAMGRLLRSMGIYVEPGDADRHDLQTASLEGVAGALEAAMGDWGVAGAWIGELDLPSAGREKPADAAPADQPTQAAEGEDAEPVLRSVAVAPLPSVRGLNQLAETTIKALIPAVELKRQAGLDGVPLQQAVAEVEDQPAAPSKPQDAQIAAASGKTGESGSSDDAYLAALETLAESLLSLDADQKRPVGSDNKSLAELPAVQ